MLFTKISSPAPVADYLAAQLTQLLTAGKHVLWLVAGGSAIEIAVLAGQRLQGTALANLTVTLTDERFGPPGHPNSNWQQLVEAGLALPGARLTPVLNGQTQAATAAAWEAALTEALANADYTLALLGIGPDGH